MSRASNKLDDMVLAAFEQACLEDQMEIAEHLLAALEGLAKQEEVEAPEFRPQLAHAYSLIAETAEKAAARSWPAPSVDRSIQ